MATRWWISGHSTRATCAKYLGMEHCRAFWTRLFPIEGDKMITNRRRAILTLTQDSSPGRHDTLIAPCDNERYGLLGCTHYHDNCRDNMHAGLAELGCFFRTRRIRSTCS